MKAILTTTALIGAWYLASNLPTAWAMPIGLATLAGILAGAVALAVKWVRNV